MLQQQPACLPACPPSDRAEPAFGRSLHGGTATWGARCRRTENGLLSVSRRPAEPVGIGVVGVGARPPLPPSSPLLARAAAGASETWVCPWRRRHRPRSPGGRAGAAARREAGSGSRSSRSSPLYLWSSWAPSRPPSATARRRPAGTAPVRVHAFRGQSCTSLPPLLLLLLLLLLFVVVFVSVRMQRPCPAAELLLGKRFSGCG